MILLSENKFYSEENLIKLSYYYFPKGIEEGTETYFRSKEFQNLLKALKKKKLFKPLIKNLFVSIRKFESNIEFEDLTYLYKFDRCVKCSIRFWAGAIRQKLKIYIRLIIPFYIASESRYNTVNNLNGFAIGYDINVTKMFLREIQTEFRKIELKEFPENFIYINVKDIQSETKGRLDNYHELNSLKEMTLFNVYFSDLEF